jgi:pimeloyl-ACP methyl ester carboxylesterase
MVSSRTVRFGGAGTPLHFAVANGFPPEAYQPMIDRLTPHFDVFSVLPRALWGEAMPENRLNWRDLGMRDMLAEWEALGVEHVVAVGHSFGGVISLLAALEAPERVKALILLDPTLFAPEIMRLIAQQYAQDPGGLPLAARALRRRRDFPDVRVAFATFRERELFADWSDESLWAYVHAGLIPDGSGGLTLRWSPEWEAHIFSTAYLETWEDVPRLAALHVPVLVVRGEQSDTFSAASMTMLQSVLPRAECVQLPAQGHLFPLAAPSATADLISTFLGGR